MPFQLPRYTWDKDRVLCQSCQHCIVRENKAARNRPVSTSLHCAISVKRSGEGPSSCIGERYEGECGIKGIKWKRRIDT